MGRSHLGNHLAEHQKPYVTIVAHAVEVMVMYCALRATLMP